MTATVTKELLLEHLTKLQEQLGAIEKTLDEIREDTRTINSQFARFMRGQPLSDG